MQVGDNLKLLSFGKDYGDDAKFNNWIYNIPSSHNVSNINQVNVNTYELPYSTRVFSILTKF